MMKTDLFAGVFSAAQPPNGRSPQRKPSAAAGDCHESVWKSVWETVSHGLMMVAPLPCAALVSDARVLDRCFLFACVIQCLIGLAVVMCVLDLHVQMWLAHLLALVFVSMLLVSAGFVQPRAKIKTV